ncbi:MAG: TlpA family protein disulfide reductase [Myxococcales bacterium]|nr:TlpA family protein disulfide reductase [Myxococcales bacterium]
MTLVLWGLACTEPEVSSQGDASVGSLLQFSLPDQAGRNLSLSDLSGTPTVIDVSAVWCLPCQEVARTLQSFADEVGDAAGVDVVTVLVEDLQTQPPTVEVAAAWATEFGLALPVLADVRQAQRDRWELGQWPTTVVVDGAGIVVARHDGDVPEDVLRRQVLEAR